MSDARRTLEAHAYVDGCLPTGERSAFEAAMARNPRLRARVEAWRAQNEAIQTAFGAAPHPRAAPVRPSNENAAPLRRPVVAARGQVVRFALAALFALAAMLYPAGGPPDPRAALAARVEAALRLLAARPAPALDFVTADPRAATAWLASRAPRLRVDAHAPGWTLAGVRLAPGLADIAALVVFEDALGDRALLWLERGDAGVDLAPRLDARGDHILLSGVAEGIEYAVAGPRGSGAAALAPRPQQP